MSIVVKTVALAGAVGLLTGTLYAADGILIVEKTTSGGASHTSQVQIEPTRMRAESTGANGERQAIVFDGTKQVLDIINMAKKTYTEMTKADVDRLASQVSGAMSQMQSTLANLPPEQRARVEAMMKGRGIPGPTGAADKNRLSQDGHGYRRQMDLHEVPGLSRRHQGRGALHGRSQGARVLDGGFRRRAAACGFLQAAHAPGCRGH